jgi:adenylate kinase
VYHAQTEPVIEFYRKRGKVLSVDGSGSVEQVRTAIKNLLAEKAGI